MLKVSRLTFEGQSMTSFVDPLGTRSLAQILSRTQEGWAPIKQVFNNWTTTAGQIAT